MIDRATQWNPAPEWPPLIVDLAKQIAAGDDCRFALHDAWEEAGLPHTPISVTTWLRCPLGSDQAGRPLSMAVGLIFGTTAPFPGERRWLKNCVARLRGATP